MNIEDLIKDGLELSSKLVISGFSYSFKTNEEQQDYIDWETYCIRFLKTNYSGDFNTEEFVKTSNYKGDLKTRISKQVSILKAIKDIPGKIKIVKDKVIQNQNVFNISQNMTNNNIYGLFKDELTGKQFDELKSLIEETKDSTDKKKKIFEKLKSFGLETVSNILAGVISNSML